MSDTMVIEIAEDEDDEVEIVYAEMPTTSKVSQLRQQIELLQAFCKSPDPIPLEYHKFYYCAKKVNPNFNDVTILSAWKRALSKQLTSVVARDKKFRFIKKTCDKPPIVDLTECDINKSNTLALPHSPTTQQLQVIDDQQESQQTTQDVVPVALFANPNFKSKIPALQTIFHNADTTGNISVVNNSAPECNLNTSSNCLDNIGPGMNITHKKYIQSTKTVQEITINISNEEISTENSEPLQTKLPILTSNQNIESECTINRNVAENLTMLDEEYSNHEKSPLGKVLDFHFMNDSNGFKQSDLTNEFITKQKKRKYRYEEKCCDLLDLSDKVNGRISKSFLGIPAKITKPMSKTKNTKKTKSMSETEFKLFRKEQKKQKLLEKRRLISKQLEIVHDRLVDVLIPKYYDNGSQSKS